MFLDFDTKVIDDYLKKNFPIIYDFKFEGLILLYGGAIKSLMMQTPVRDLDFTLLTQNDGNILEFITKNNMEFIYNSFGGYKLNYNDLEIDIGVTADLFSLGQFNTDLLFYDINRHCLIPFGLKFAIEKKVVVTHLHHGFFQRKKRLIKTKRFIKFFLKDKKEKIRETYSYNKYASFIRLAFKNILNFKSVIKEEKKFRKYKDQY